MAEMMRAIVKTAPGKGAELLEVPRPEPGAGDALIRVTATSICGTDLHIYEWNAWAEGRIGPRVPQTMGHEFCGVVEAVGEGVDRVTVGDRVSAETHIVCHTCLPCRRDQYEVCLNTSILGVDRDGSFADYIVVPAENLWINPPELSDNVASALEPLGNAVHTAMAESLDGKRVLVTGIGPIGAFSVGVARALGATEVFASEPNAYRRALAGAMGADHLIDPGAVSLVGTIMELTGDGVDAVLEMSGHPTAIQDAISCVIPGGHIAQLGLPPDLVTLDLNKLIFKGIRFYGIAGRKMWETWEEMTRLLASGRLDISPVLTHTLELEAFGEGMRLMEAGECGKVVLTVS
ncbi:L-threonine 3-dehydrogenase [Gemmatimonadota bacterium]